MPLSPPTRTLERLGHAECLRLLSARYLGRLAYLANGRPQVVPMNYVVDGERLVVRMDTGGVLGAVLANPEVAFETDHADFAYRAGWSVVAHGTAALVDDPVEVQRLRALPLRPWAPGDRDHYVQIVPSRLSGRRIR